MGNLCFILNSHIVRLYVTYADATICFEKAEYAVAKKGARRDMMNFYDKNEPAELPESRGTKLAQRVERRKTVYGILDVLILIGLVALAVFENIKNPTAEIGIMPYVWLAVSCLAASVCFYVWGNNMDTYRAKKRGFDSKEIIDYLLANYRSRKKMSAVNNAFYLFMFLLEDVKNGKMERAEMAREQLQLLLKGMENQQAKTYYFFSTAMDFFEGKDSWRLELEKYKVIPLQNAPLSEEQIGDLFERGDREEILNSMAQWIYYPAKKVPVKPVLFLLLGSLILSTGLYMEAEKFLPAGTYYNYGFAIGAAIVLFLGWVIMLTWITVLMCMLVKASPMAKFRKGLLIVCLILEWILVNFLSLGSFVGAYHRAEVHRTEQLTQAQAFTKFAETLEKDENMQNEAQNEESIENQQSTENQNSTENSSQTSPITKEEFDHFSVTADASSVKNFDRFDDFAETMGKDFTGTWYDPEMGEAIRLTNQGAYVYIPYLEMYGDECYEWELIDRSDSGLCPKLAIYHGGRDVGALVYYVAGCTENYFWCNGQAQIFYRQ